MNDPVVPFAPGMIVSLKSGGPAMTVADVGDAGGTIKCRWFKVSGDLAEASFGSSELRRGWKQHPIAPAVPKLRALT